ncbi:Alpha/Beta hydrolase protein [Truncatella angustata]|uniref:Alpha/Beta hydrolase protein n=1 Tax=Truncatella angustata TaxID=152316 RepID=A0A9P8UV65_9PEZI|nr:Alpha/Beta hydrolase protein [Truncatella angustata]KAH6658978.1 Alpha/Beta hydrolase protein [Truncatella angustata]KAH8203215.1 hypothetical protein TruAng_002620 [Truncatella angustata]
MPDLEVPGAILHYETFGTKESLLIFIPGADGRGSIFHPSAQLLTDQFTVVCWDRRGYSQSFFVGQQHFEQRLQTDADDAMRLIRHLSPNGSATVFGTSSGAIVALQLLARHSGCVTRLVVHEPPAFSVLPQEFQQQAYGLIRHIYDTYRAHGSDTAMEAFASGLSEGPDSKMMRHCMDAKRGDEIRANCLFWFEFELRQYTSATVDVQGLQRMKHKLVLVAGEDSGDGPGVGPIMAIARQVEEEVIRIPGGHLGFMIVPKLFAKKLLELLSK